MEKILHGIADFIRRRPGLKATFRRLAHGQHPVALLLACSDSRVVPSLLLGTDPGDLFEVRTVGNLIAPAGVETTASAGDESGAAAVEYALLALGVRHIVVMGHSGCGAMKAVLAKQVPPGAINLERWLAHARGATARLEASPSIDRALTPADRLSQANVLQQLDHIRSYAIAAARLERGELELHGAWFDVERADLYVWSREQGLFFRADEAAVALALARRSAAPA